jgi:hypothetical protein
MKYEFLVNEGSVGLILCPENEMEEQLLKGLVKQPLDIVEIRTAVTVVNKTLKGGVMIKKKDSPGPALVTTESDSDESKT